MNHNKHKRLTVITAGFAALEVMDPKEAETLLAIFEKMTVNSLREKTLGRRSHVLEVA